MLYKLKTMKLFEKPSSLAASSSNPSQSANGAGSGAEFEDLFAIEYLAFSAENRILCVAGASSQVIVFRFSKQESQTEISVNDFASPPRY